MKSILLLIFVLCGLGPLLQGCASYTAFTGIVRTEGAIIADKEMDAAVFFLCKGSTIGAWVRRFGGNKQSADAWGVICADKSTAPSVLP